jgi:hypothetical protein
MWSKDSNWRAREEATDSDSYVEKFPTSFSEIIDLDTGENRGDVNQANFACLLLQGSTVDYRERRKSRNGGYQTPVIHNVRMLAYPRHISPPCLQSF